MAKFIGTTSEYPHRVRDMLRVSTASFGDKDAILVREKTSYKAYTYKRLKSDVDALGAALLERELGGKTVLILGENGYEWVLALLTALCHSMVAVPVDKTLSATDVAQLCLYTEASAILYSDNYPEAVAALPEDVTAIPFSSFRTLVAEGTRLLAQDGKDANAIRGDENAPALILLSSGNGNSPRDITLSNKNLGFTAEHTATALHMRSSDILLSHIPLHHAYELICGLLVPLTVGATVAFGEGLHAIMKNIKEVSPTVLVTAPVVAEALWNKAQRIFSAGYGKLGEASVAASNLLPDRFSTPAKKKLFEDLHAFFGGSLRMVFCGSAAAPAHVMKGLRDIGILALEGYGPCECSAVLAVNPARAPRYGSVGKPLSDSVLDVYNKGEDGTGEIRIKSEGIMLGYFKNQTATNEAIRDGWLYTGDLGYIDRDGYLFVTGRKKNVLVRATGRHVFPEEIEALLTKQPFVKEAVVIGFVNDAKRDYDLVAVVYPDKQKLIELYGENYSVCDAQSELENAVKAVNDLLPDYKHIDMLIQRKSPFEKTGTRKIRRAGVAASVSEEYYKKRS